VKLETLTPVGWSASSESELLEERADRRGVAIDARLRGGEVAGRGRVGDRPGGEVGHDVLLGEPADGDRTVGLARPVSPSPSR
jgi:hypothetical protein